MKQISSKTIILIALIAGGIACVVTDYPFSARLFLYCALLVLYCALLVLMLKDND